MIIPLHPRLTDAEFKELEDIASEFSVRIQPIHGHERSIYAILGDETSQDLINRIEGLPYIERIDRIQVPYKLMAKESKLSQPPGEGGEQVAAGRLLRHRRPLHHRSGQQSHVPGNRPCGQGGRRRHDPRRRLEAPHLAAHAFQGDARSLDILLEAREQTGPPVNTEVMDFEQLKLCVEAKVDSLQIGARSALNYRLLQQVGELTKDSRHARAAQAQHAHGPGLRVHPGRRVHRGPGQPQRHALPARHRAHHRGLPQLPRREHHLAPQGQTWAPVVVDPSHAVGKGVYVPNACLAAAGYGADGILVETHCQPKKGMGDDPKQAVTPDVLAQIVKDTREIHRYAKKYARPEPGVPVRGPPLS